MSTITTPDSYTVTADDARRHFEGTLEQYPEYNRVQEPRQALAIAINWVATLFGLLLQLLDATVRELRVEWAQDRGDGSQSGESDSSSSTPPVSTTAPPPTRSRATAGSTVQAHASAPAASRSKQHCAKCHAMGHSAPECLTQDPAAMRKRIAGNRQQKQGRRADQRPLPPFFPAPAFSPYPQPFPLPFAAQGYDAAFVVDAEELRRRRHQSARDRRKHRAAPANP